MSEQDVTPVKKRRKLELTVMPEVKAVEPGTPWPAKNSGRAPAERTPAQKRLDHDGETVYAQWVKAGRPVSLNLSPRIRYRVSPGQADALLAGLRKVVAKNGPLDGKQLKYATETDDDGFAVFHVVYRDKPVEK